MVEFAYRGPTYNFRVWEKGVTNEDFASYIKELVCYNQGEYIQYACVAAEFHKAMRIAHEQEDAATAQTLKSTQLDYLNRNLDRVTRRNFELFRTYFRGRSPHLPRTCVKGSSPTDGSSSIIPLFRDSKVNYSVACAIEHSTGFKYVHETGRPYLCNDIPRAVAAGEYLNPRLDTNAARSYEPPSLFKKLLRRDRGPDERWARFWNNGGTPTSNRSTLPDSCYKSTLIVPMTLWNNDLEDSFKEMINISDVDRAIFGFLCADHVDTGYFHSALDVEVAYVVADILSLYFVQRLVLTNASGTFEAILGL